MTAPTPEMVAAAAKWWDEHQCVPALLPTLLARFATEQVEKERETQAAAAQLNDDIWRGHNDALMRLISSGDAALLDDLAATRAKLAEAEESAAHHELDANGYQRRAESAERALADERNGNEQLTASRDAERKGYLAMRADRDDALRLLAMTREALTRAHEYSDELYSYASDWDWKYGEEWEAERTAMSAALAATSEASQAWLAEHDAKVRADEFTKCERRWCEAVIPEGTDAIERITKRSLALRSPEPDEGGGAK